MRIWSQARHNLIPGNGGTFQNWPPATVKKVELGQAAGLQWPDAPSFSSLAWIYSAAKILRQWQLAVAMHNTRAHGKVG